MLGLLSLDSSSRDIKTTYYAGAAAAMLAQNARMEMRTNMLKSSKTSEGMTAGKIILRVRYTRERSLGGQADLYALRETSEQQ
jgi:hypothetical protein